eukprot:4188022-Pyramimonas_sp.AAC.1
MFASAAWKRCHDKVKEKGGFRARAPPAAAHDGGGGVPAAAAREAADECEEPDDKDVDTLWQATKGEKRNLLEQLRAMGYKRPKRGYGDKAKDQIKAWSRAHALKEPAARGNTRASLTAQRSGFRTSSVSWNTT